MDPAAVFATLSALGGTPPRTIVIGCEVENVEEGMGLSEAVTAAVPRPSRRSTTCVASLPHGQRYAEG